MANVAQQTISDLISDIRQLEDTMRYCEMRINRKRLAIDELLLSGVTDEETVPAPVAEVTDQSAQAERSLYKPVPPKRPIVLPAGRSAGGVISLSQHVRNVLVAMRDVEVIDSQEVLRRAQAVCPDRKSTRLNSSH